MGVRSSLYTQFVCRLQSWDSGLLSNNFDGLSLTGAKIFAFEICLENRTDFEENNSVLTLFIYLMMLLSERSSALCARIRGVFLMGHFVGSSFGCFWGSFFVVIFLVIWGGHFEGLFWGGEVTKVLSRNLIVFALNSGGQLKKNKQKN